MSDEVEVVPPRVAARGDGAPASPWALSVEHAERAVPAAALARPPSYETHARERLGMPADWRLAMWRAEGDDGDIWGITVEGGVCPPKQHGKYKGLPDWRRATLKRKVTFTKEELAAWIKQWEADTGLCSECSGSGRAFASWSAKEGNRYRDCPQCKATGNATLGGERGAGVPASAGGNSGRNK